MWQRHNAQLANFDVTSLRVTVAATTQPDVRVICLNYSELTPLALGEAMKFDRRPAATTGGLSSRVRMKSALSLRRMASPGH